MDLGRGIAILTDVFHDFSQYLPECCDKLLTFFFFPDCSHLQFLSIFLPYSTLQSVDLKSSLNNLRNSASVDQSVRGYLALYLGCS